jgi:hypothetical protein
MRSGRKINTNKLVIPAIKIIIMSLVDPQKAGLLNLRSTKILIGQ